MSDFIVTNNQSPFDSIRHEDTDGEFWLARELMPLLGYTRWNEFEDVIDRAKAACQNTGNSILQHFSGSTLKTKGRPQQEYRLSRYACYLTAQNGDPRKPEVAAAQSYFAVKTREAETVIPAQSDRIRELELENENLRIKSDIATLHGKEFAAMAIGGGVIRVEVPVTEIVEPATDKRVKILTASQLKEIVKRRTGQNLPSLKWFADELRAMGRDDLLVPVTRSATSEYPIPEKLDEAIALIYGKTRQTLIGEHG